MAGAKGADVEVDVKGEGLEDHGEGGTMRENMLPERSMMNRNNLGLCASWEVEFRDQGDHEDT